MHYYKVDALGRRYKYDRYGNRILKKGPMKGSLKPPEMASADWRALSKAGQKQMVAVYDAARKAGIKVAAPTVIPSQSAAQRARSPTVESTTTTTTTHNPRAHIATLITCLASAIAMGASADAMHQEIERILCIR